MNLAIEYLLRNKRARNLITVPCSLFLNGEHKLVITIHSSYGSSETLLIKHWRIWDNNNKIPSFTEFVIQREELFTSPHTIVKGYTLLDYIEEPFIVGAKQYTTFPQGVVQAKEYNDRIDNFYNTKAHNEKRLTWLWEQFKTNFIPGDMQLDSNVRTNLKLQMEVLEFYSRPLWHFWEYWQSLFLISQKVAAELVFKAEYPLPKPVNRMTWVDLMPTNPYTNISYTSMGYQTVASSGTTTTPTITFTNMATQTTTTPTITFTN